MHPVAGRIDKAAYQDKLADSQRLHLLRSKGIVDMANL